MMNAKMIADAAEDNQSVFTANLNEPSSLEKAREKARAVNASNIRTIRRIGAEEFPIFMTSSLGLHERHFQVSSSAECRERLEELQERIAEELGTEEPEFIQDLNMTKLAGLLSDREWLEDVLVVIRKAELTREKENKLRLEKEADKKAYQEQVDRLGFVKVRLAEELSRTVNALQGVRDGSGMRIISEVRGREETIAYFEGCTDTLKSALRFIEGMD